jgi:hypothetical protein
MGPSLYTMDRLNGNEHARQVLLLLSTTSANETSNNVGPKMVSNRDIFCRGSRDNSTGVSTYEIKISRDYLRGCNSPDNLLSYVVKFANLVEVRTNLDKEARAELKEMGLKKTLYWTYSYAYFGSRPEVTPVEPETTEPETTVVTEPDTTVADTEPVTTTPEDTTAASNENKGGCSSAVSMVTVGIVTLALGAMAVCKKKKD